MSLTTTLNLFELFSFRVHLDNTMCGLCRRVTRRYTVNDVITGWIEIVSAKQKMKSITMSLIRNETFSYLGFPSLRILIARRRWEESVREE